MKEITPFMTTMIEQVSEGIIIVDDQGKVRCVNEAALDLLDLPSTAKPRTISDIKTFDLMGALSHAIEQTGDTMDNPRQAAGFLSFDHQHETRNGIRHLRFRTGLCNVPNTTNRYRAVMIQDRTGEQLLDNLVNFRDSGGMITENPTMLDILARVKHIAESNASLLLQGESGTGKTLLARMIHKHSTRRDERFVEVSCAAIPDALIESELFGHVKGAFTSAVDDRQGRFQTAHNGTLFLDEVGEIPLNLQPKLLKALQDQEFEKVGSDRTVKVDVRVISASNLDLRSAVDDGKFRPDLYYRLAVIPIHIPPLRDRLGDVPLLIKHFYQRLAARGYADDIGFSRAAIRSMMDYPWPGNIRELSNAVEHGIICAEDKVVTADSLPQDIREYTDEHSRSSAAVLDAEEQEERRQIIDMLKETQGNRAETAKRLGVDRSTLWRRIKRLRIDPEGI